MAASLDASKDDYACRHFGLSVLCFYLFFILVLSAQDVFTLINSRRYACLDVSPYVAFFEIYNGKVWTPGSAAPQTCRIYIFHPFQFQPKLQEMSCPFRSMTYWTTRLSCVFWRMSGSRFRWSACRKWASPQRRTSSRSLKLAVLAGTSQCCQVVQIQKPIWGSIQSQEAAEIKCVLK